MTLKETLQDDLKNAMRSGDVMRRSVIRMLRSEIHNREIESRSELDDAATIQLMGRQAQQRRDSIEAFERAERDDLVQKERAELAVIMGYLPEQLTRRVSCWRSSEALSSRSAPRGRRTWAR